MSEAHLASPANPAPAWRFLPLLVLLFAGSGCSALIYEIVWFQLLELVIGSTAVSLAVLLGTFMGGMCLGSIALPRLVSPRRHPLRVYGLIELALGATGVAVLFGMPYLDRVYSEAAGSGLPAVLLRGALCGVCLLPPTLLMGATLPAVARWVEATPQGVAWLGWFYGANIAGAVVGCLLAGFYLLRVYDMAAATYVAAALNGAVALLALTLAAVARHAAPTAAPPPERAAGGRGPWPVYVAIALSGAGALAAEVIWTRLLSLLLGGTVYTFSIILAVFLVGLGLGSGTGSFLARTGRHPRALLGACQFLLAAAVAWAALMLADSLPYWPVDPRLSPSPWFNFQLDLVRCLWAVLPAACLWGASFPLALAAAAQGQDPGRLVGGVYAANTVGAIAGAVAASLFLIPQLGTQEAQRILIGLSAVAAVLLLAPSFRPTVAPRVVGLVLAAACVAAPAALLAWAVPAVPWRLVAFGRLLSAYDDSWYPLYTGEGMNSSVAVTALPNGDRNFHVSGKVEASTSVQDLRVERMLGDFPALFHPRPRSALVVGCGAGITAGSFLVQPGVENVTICEIEPLVPRDAAPFFADANHDVVHDPHVQIVYDDARHYVLTTPRKFDVITSDPIHPWVKGSATLYTKEYFELCKARLNPGGLITQWVPLYESSPDVVRSELATFFEVFPDGTVWSNEMQGGGYDVVLLGQAGPLTVDADQLQQRLDRPDHAAVKKDLEDVGFKTVVGLLKTYGGQAQDLRPWLAGAAVNRDRDLRLQYLAGMAGYKNQTNVIYEDMLKYRRFPENVFVGSGPLAQALRLALDRSVSAHEAAGGNDQAGVPR